MRARPAAEPLVLPGEPVVVGVSGGPDSTALLHMLRGLGAAPTAAHLDHGLRPGSGADADAVGRFCAGLGVPLVVERVVGLARGEAAARDARYAFLARVAQDVGARKVAVAHTADDQAETVLLRLVRGSGADGLAGMPARRHLAAGVELVRPLLGTTRTQVLAYCRMHRLEWREDESNRDPTWLRNRVRHELLPLLASSFNPAIGRVLRRTAGLLAEDAEALALWTDREAARRISAGGLDGRDWTGVPPAIRRRLVRRLWATVTGLPPLGARHVAAALDGPATLPGGWRAEWRDGNLRLECGRRLAARPFAYELPVPGCLDVPEAGWRITADGPTQPPLVVRSRRPGDRLLPFGGVGTRKLQDLLVDARVPRAERDRVAVVARGDGTILWVVGIRRAEALRQTGLRLDAAPLS